MSSSRFVLAFVLASLAPASAVAQGRVAGDAGDQGFLLSARLAAPWTIVATVEYAGLSGVTPVSLPRFVVGAQLGRFGVGAGLNYWYLSDRVVPDASSESTSSLSLLLAGPTLSYLLLQSRQGHAQLHVLASAVFGIGGLDAEDGDADADLNVLGFDAGVMGRARVADGLGVDVGLCLDYSRLGVQGRDEEYVRNLQLVGFLGLSLIV